MNASFCSGVSRLVSKEIFAKFFIKNVLSSLIDEISLSKSLFSLNKFISFFLLIFERIP